MQEDVSEDPIETSAGIFGDTNDIYRQEEIQDEPLAQSLFSNA